MKKWIILFILTGGFNFVYADEYIKNNGTLSLSSDNGAVTFSINASHINSSGICNMEGVAESVGAGSGQRNRWIYSASSSACLAVISELKDGSVNVMTRSCESYCDVSAIGSMDGKYK
ncbi:acyl-CoA dehydrogenase [Atlantibacter hermannii]|uniref:acyl-CoA dehydrogenase n=1 Tax=Atlantibacter hermannii TaxID=565 RepID=UPI0028033A61|nr:acyl-CoA dehydrogenase [Atlantibacter hermannii]MDQ7883939.1 acyl-CoA dehydrogenase [Atlantibacter hermannii]